MKMNKSLLAATCLLLASKFYEIDDNLILSDDFTRKVDKRITYETLTRSELFVLNKLKWNLLHVMPIDYIQIAFKLGLVQKSDQTTKDRNISNFSQTEQEDLAQKVGKQSLKLTEFCAHNLKLRDSWKPSELGYAILILTRQINSLKDEWALDFLSHYVRDKETKLRINELKLLIISKLKEKDFRDLYFLGVTIAQLDQIERTTEVQRTS